VISRKGTALSVETIPAAVPDWNQYNEWNARHLGLSALWLKKLIHWLFEQRLVTPTTKVLDYGCSHFDLGVALQGRCVQIDGYDIDSKILAFARERLPKQTNSRLYGTESPTLPESFYDLIVVNSVLQYLTDSAELEQTLSLFKKLLRPDGGGKVVISDLIPKNYSASRDAFRSLYVATMHGMFWSMLQHLYRAATKPSDFKLLAYAKEEVAAAAAKAGFATTFLRKNLTPSLQRYSCVLIPHVHADRVSTPPRRINFW
jgi:ubiquinone/menaquinone biosynthesis C-methylase UbiE